MPWLRKGRVLCIDHLSPSLMSHATYPTPLITNDVLRVFFSSRDGHGIGSVCSADLDPNEPTRVIRINESPLLGKGERGTFDDSGTQPNFVIRKDDQVYLYYMGWNLGVTFRYRNSIGLAVSDNEGETFVRAFPGPVLERAVDEPFFAISPALLQDGENWRCWYTSGLGYREIDGDFEWDFAIRHATSRDGVEFVRDALPCVEPKFPGEVHTRAYVLKDEGVYKMWLSYRTLRDFRGGKNSYRIGYAQSDDGHVWSRRDEFGGLDTSSEGWDSEMTCFASVIDVGSRRYMLYNGNGFGKSGIGIAEWRD